jgi:hypothetical protein
MGQVIGFKVDEKLRNLIKEYAWRHKMTVSEYVRQAVIMKLQMDMSEDANGHENVD